MKIAMPKFLKNADMFGAPIPNFNLRGRAEVKTSCGACISIVIFMLTFLFGVLKLQHLLTRKNPLITQNTIPLEAGERFDTGSDDFMMAFAVEDKKGVPKNDTQYLRWMQKVQYEVDGIRTIKTEKLLKLCTQDDMAKFYPPKNQETANDVELHQDAGNLYCLDQKSES